MAWGAPRNYPRAIVHIDGDSFFASCEIAKDPRLQGKPVITGKERGIVSAMTYDVKRRGVTRGMILSDAKKLCPDAIILPSDYETYSIFSERMYEIARRYSSMVEEYSIDECFVDLTGLRQKLRMSYLDAAKKIKEDLQRELGMTFSLGLSATKVLAKLGSKWHKPDGLTAIPLSRAREFLAQTPCGKVWGIGPNTAAYLEKFGIRSALQLVDRSEEWMKEHTSKPVLELWRELSGEAVLELTTAHKTTYQSIQKTRTFTPPSRDERFIFSQLSKNVENACIKARRWDLASPEIFFFLKTQDFRYFGCEIKLPNATNVPEDLLRAIAEYFPKVHKKRGLYRATGITLLKLQSAAAVQLDLFGKAKRTEGVRRVYESIDQICERYGKHTVFLASSIAAMTHLSHAGERGEATARQQNLFRGEEGRRRLGLPLLGEVT